MDVASNQRKSQNARAAAVRLSPMALRRRIRRSRRSLVMHLAVALVLTVVAMHHAGAMPAGPGDVGGMSGTDDGAVAVVMCLGVLGLAAVALAARPALGRLLPLPGRPSDWRLPEVVTAVTLAPLSRDGPALHVRLSVWLR